MQRPLHWRGASSLAWFICVVAAIWSGICWGDQVETITGDRYVGRVVSLGNDTLVLQSEILGTLKLPRKQISTISLGPISSSQATNGIRIAPNSLSQVAARSNLVVRAVPAASRNVTNQFNAAIGQLGTNSSVISQVQEQFLAGAGPEAQSKFNELVAGLMSGKLGVNEIRAQAKTTLDQARAAQKELGDEGSSMEGYLSILESFLKESAPAIEPNNQPVGAGQKLTVQKPSEDE